MKKILLLAFTMFLFSTNVFAGDTKLFEYDYKDKCKDADAEVIDCTNDKEYLTSALKEAEAEAEAEAERVSILKEIKAEVSQCANDSISLFKSEDVKECQEIILGNFCDNKKADSKKKSRKCEKKTKIAESINEKFSVYLTIPAVKYVCDKILIGNKIETNVLKLDGIETSYIRKCRRGAKKYERLEKRAKNVDGKSDKKLAETKCLAKADFKKIDKCIKKVKIQYKLNSDFKEYLSKASVKDACKKDLITSSSSSSLITNSYKDTFALRDLKKCQKSAKKMKKLTSKAEKNKNADNVCLVMPTLAKVKSCVKDFAKAKKICKKLKRKLKKCKGGGCETFSDDCETITSQDKLKKYEAKLKKVKTIITTDRKEGRKEKIKKVKNKFKKKKKTK